MQGGVRENRPGGRIDESVLSGVEESWIVLFLVFFLDCVLGGVSSKPL